LDLQHQKDRPVSHLFWSQAFVFTLMTSFVPVCTETFSTLKAAFDTDTMNWSRSPEVTVDNADLIGFQKGEHGHLKKWWLAINEKED